MHWHKIKSTILQENVGCHKMLIDMPAIYHLTFFLLLFTQVFLFPVQICCKNLWGKKNARWRYSPNLSLIQIALNVGIMICSWRKRNQLTVQSLHEKQLTETDTLLFFLFLFLKKGSLVTSPLQLSGAFSFCQRRSPENLKAWYYIFLFQKEMCELNNSFHIPSSYEIEPWT